MLQKSQNISREREITMIKLLRHLDIVLETAVCCYVAMHYVSECVPAVALQSSTMKWNRTKPNLLAGSVQQRAASTTMFRFHQ